MEKRHLSATQIGMFLRCPRQYEFRYMQGLKQPPSGAMVQSKVWHRTVEENYRQKIESAKDLPLPRMEEFYAAQYEEALKAEEIAFEAGTNPGRLKDTMIYGYSIIDSLKVIIDVPVHEYIKMYGKTPERALIFMQVGSGRSPMIAVKVGRFSTEMRPALVVLHGIDKVDPIAQKIAESEKIPLLITTRTIEEIKKALKEFET